MKVLIVDDEQDMLNMINAFLRRYKDIDIITSRNGEEAYHMILKESPDLAIIDGLIPGIHGFELCKKVKEDKKLESPPRIIIMSGIYKGLKYKFDVIKTYFADDYLEKPFNKEELLSRIEKLTGALELREDRHAGIEVPEIVNEIPDEKKGDEINPEMKEMIEDMYGKCDRLGYYGVLGVREQAAPGEIKAAYHKAVKKYHPDMHLHLDSDSLKNKLNYVFSYISEAYSILSNPEKRREYDKVLTIKPARLAAVQDRARSAFEEGKKSLKEQNYQEAEHSFEEAIYYDATISEYHYYYGLTLTRQHKFKEAEKAFEAARRLEPFNAGYLTELGLVYMELGYPARAKGFLEKALSVSPDNARAAEGLKKIKDVMKSGKRK